MAHNLATNVLARFRDTMTPVPIGAEVSGWSQGIVAEFPVASDPMIDIKRLPADTNNLAELTAWLNAARTRIADVKIDTKTDGTLRTYKTIIICAHAINIYLRAVPTPAPATWSVHATNVITHAAINPPEFMSTKSLTLWKAVMNASIGRVKAIIIMILSMPPGITIVTAPAPAPGPAPAPLDDPAVKPTGPVIPNVPAIVGKGAPDNFKLTRADGEPIHPVMFLPAGWTKKGKDYLYNGTKVRKMDVEAIEDYCARAYAYEASLRYAELMEKVKAATGT